MDQLLEPCVSPDLFSGHLIKTSLRNDNFKSSLYFNYFSLFRINLIILFQKIEPFEHTETLNITIKLLLNFR